MDLLSERTAPAEVSGDAEPHSDEPSRQLSVLYTPVRVTIGDGFKFGCGFLIPFVLAMLVAFVLVSVLIVASVVTGVDLPFVQ